MDSGCLRFVFEAQAATLDISHQFPTMNLIPDTCHADIVCSSSSSPSCHVSKLQSVHRLGTTLVEPLFCLAGAVRRAAVMMTRRHQTSRGTVEWSPRPNPVPFDLCGSARKAETSACRPARAGL